MNPAELSELAGYHETQARRLRDASTVCAPNYKAEFVADVSKHERWAKQLRQLAAPKKAQIRTLRLRSLKGGQS